MIKPAKRWIVRTPPLPDELMSSWLHRMALANRHTNHSFVATMFGRDVQIWTRDLDRSFRPELLPDLSQWACVSQARLEQLLLTSWLGTVAESITGSFRCTWLLPVGVYHRSRLAAGLQFCPQCLAEDIPYARKAWRGAFVTECPTHRVGLLDRCPCCAAPFVYHRSLPDRQGRRHCRCGADFASMTSPVKSGSTVLRLQARLLRSANLGWTRMSGRWVGSLVLFTGVRHLLYVLTSPKMTNLTALVVPPHLRPQADRFMVFENLPVAQRRSLLKAVSEWLMDWPDKFLRDVARSRSYRGFLFRKRKDTVSWIQVALDQCPTAQPHRITDMEVEACRTWLIRRGEIPSFALIADALGLDLVDRMWPANRSLISVAAIDRHRILRQ